MMISGRLIKLTLDSLAIDEINLMNAVSAGDSWHDKHTRAHGHSQSISNRESGLLAT